MSYKELQQRIDSPHGNFDQSGIDFLIPHQFPTSRNPEIPKSRIPEIPKSRNPEIPKSRNPHPLRLGHSESGMSRSIVTEAKICSVETPNSFYCYWPAWRRSFSFQSALRTRLSKKI